MLGIQSTLNGCAQIEELYLLTQSSLSEARMKSQSKRNSSTSDSKKPSGSHVRKLHRKLSLFAVLTHPSRGRVL